MTVLTVPSLDIGSRWYWTSIQSPIPFSYSNWEGNFSFGMVPIFGILSLWRRYFVVGGSFPFGGLVPFWYRDVFSVSRGRRLKDLSLAVVYISPPRPAHAHCARWLDTQI